MAKRNIVIIGAGAAGLMAAVTAAENGAAVTVLEQNDRPGRKIAATGNGKCNFTNMEIPADAYRGTHPEFVRESLEQFPVSRTIQFFEELGIFPVNRRGCLYPRSGQAQSITDVLCMKARSLGVKIKTNEKVTSLSSGKKEGHHIWKVHTEGWCYESDCVILANGSKASSISGSNGSGYVLAESLGHKIIAPLPALVPLKCKGKKFSSWAGTRTEGRISVFSEGELLKEEQGELQLTEYGVSGIPVFQVSRYAAKALSEGKKVQAFLDFLPDYKEDQVQSLLETRKKQCPYKNQKELFTGLFPEKLVKVLFLQEDLVSAIKKFPLTVTGTMPLSQAQVCAGGVDTEEVSSRTLESLLCPGIFFAGELLDIDGACGGYNLQWAWASGAVSGMYAAKPYKTEKGGQDL